MLRFALTAALFGFITVAGLLLRNGMVRDSDVLEHVRDAFSFSVLELLWFDGFCYLVLWALFLLIPPVERRGRLVKTETGERRERCMHALFARPLFYRRWAQLLVVSPFVMMTLFSVGFLILEAKSGCGYGLKGSGSCIYQGQEIGPMLDSGGQILLLMLILAVPWLWLCLGILFVFWILAFIVRRIK